MGMDASGWHSGWPWAAMNGFQGLSRTKRIFENDNLRNDKKFKICFSTKNSDALERNIFVICENDMLRNGNLGLKMVCTCNSSALKGTVTETEI